MPCPTRCAACPAERHAACETMGCHVHLAGLRVVTVPGRSGAASTHVVYMEPSDTGPLDLSTPDFDAELKRLDVESGDILVLRTRRKLSVAVVEKWQDELLRLCRAHGVRDVSVLVLDDRTDLSVERPARPDHVTIRKTQNVGKTEHLLDAFVSQARADTRMQHQARREPPIVSH